MKEKIAEFLRKNVIGKQLHTVEVIYLLEDGNLEGAYTDQMLFSDLTISELGLQFNMTTITKEQIYTLDNNKKRISLKKDFSGTSVFRYELAMRKSTGAITGFMHVISSTVKDHTMEAVVYGVYDVQLESNQLKWKEQQLFYRDMPAGGNKFRPVAFDSDIRFYFENDKLVFEYIPVYFDVDPVTFRKTLSTDKYPPYITKEK